MKRDEVWERLKGDETKVYGQSMLDVFLKTTEELELRHWDGLPESKKAIVAPQARLDLARTPEEAEKAMKGVTLDTDIPLEKALNRGDMGMAEFFVRKSGQKSKWALDIVASEGKIGMVRKLVQWGIKPTNHTLDYAASSGRLEVVQYLIDASPDTSWEFAIDSAARGGHLDIVKYLVPKAAPSQIKRALWNAATNTQPAVTEFLLDAAGVESERDYWLAVAKGPAGVDALLDRKENPNDFLLWVAEEKMTEALDYVLRNYKHLKAEFFRRIVRMKEHRENGTPRRHAERRPGGEAT